MDLKFDYEFGGTNIFGDIYRPTAKVTFISPSLPQKKVDVWMIVDTGADYSILPKHLIEKLRINLESDCTKDVTYGVGGQKAIYQLRNKIQVKFGNIDRKVPIAFFDSDEVPALMGRLGFLETFDTEFLKSHSVVFKP